MKSRIALQIWAAKQKEAYPEKFCPRKGCLWRTGGGYCPRHEPKVTGQIQTDAA